MPDRFRVIDEVIERHLSELALPGVLSVRAGWKFTGGWPVDPPTPAVAITVAEKSLRPAGRVLLPTAIEAVAVDVRQAFSHKRETLENLDAGTASRIDPATGALTEIHE